MKHKHYDVLLAWLGDQTLEIEWLSAVGWEKACYGHNPISHPIREWRIKPKMVKVGRHEWPTPLSTVPDGDVWAWSFEYQRMQRLSSPKMKELAVEHGVGHATESAALKHAVAMICINRGDIE